MADEKGVLAKEPGRRAGVDDPSAAHHSPQLISDPVARRHAMHSLIYLVGLIVVILAVLSLFGLT